MIHEILDKENIQNYGFAPLSKPLTMDYYKTWIENSMHAEMDYLKRHIPQKENPQLLVPKAISAIVITEPYFPVTKPVLKNSQLRIAMYARQKDYHSIFQSKLDNLCRKLKRHYPEDEFIAFTDSKPILERDLAYRAGLGWIGKNTCLIHEKKGSLFFIGEIYTTLKIEARSNIAPDRCGTCTKCIDICPTQALEAPKVLNANKCISFWNIESKKTPPLKLAENFQSFYFGCDLCQVVCPWNQKVFKAEMKSELNYHPINKQQFIDELVWILNSSSEEIKNKFKDTPLLRAKPWAHKRNAIIVAVNQNIKEILPYLDQFKMDEKLKDLSLWAQEKLK